MLIVVFMLKNNNFNNYGSQRKLTLTDINTASFVVLK